MNHGRAKVDSDGRILCDVTAMAEKTATRRVIGSSDRGSAELNSVRVRFVMRLCGRFGTLLEMHRGVAAGLFEALWTLFWMQKQTDC